MEFDLKLCSPYFQDISVNLCNPNQRSSRNPLENPDSCKYCTYANTYWLVNWSIVFYIYFTYLARRMNEQQVTSLHRRAIRKKLK